MSQSVTIKSNKYGINLILDTDKLSIFDGEISKDNGNCSKHCHSCDGSDRFKLSGRIGEQSNEFFH